MPRTDLSSSYFVPIGPPAQPGDVIAWRRGRALSRATLVADARILAARLPERSFVANVCSDRYNFLVAFTAAMLRGQVTLLSGDRSRRAIAGIAAEHPRFYLLHDGEGTTDPTDCEERILVDAPGDRPVGDPGPGLNTIPADRVVARVFTSGTTGLPSGHDKRLATLLARGRFYGKLMEKGVRCVAPEPPSIVATVPAQHMYGFEASILAPLFCSARVATERPLLPADVGRALSFVREPRVLVTTPFHLRALARARPVLPPVAAVISATAPLSASLAGQIEDLFSTQVLEVYGCTEVGAMASRRTTEGSIWHCDESIRLHMEKDRCVAEADHLGGLTELNDEVELLSPQSFKLLGRGTDIVCIAGKRASLSGLNTILLEIDGVVDGSFFQPPEREVEGAERLIAFVVAPGSTANAIRNALRSQVDSAFLPRRIYLVDELPRSGPAKLTRSALLDLAQRLGAGAE